MSKRDRWGCFTTAAVGAVLGFLISALIACLMPRVYESEAVIEVRPLAEEKSSPAVDPVDGDDETPRYMRTAVEQIKSHDMLGTTVESLKLARRWSVDREAAISILRENVNPRTYRGTDLIIITVRDTNPEEAQEIAAELAQAYKEYRDGIQRRDQEQMLGESQKAEKDQEEAVERKRQALAEIERTMRGNIQVEGAETLLHLPESKEYRKAKQDLQNGEQHLHAMKLEAMRPTFLNDESVLLHVDPQVAVSPVSPDVRLMLTLGTAGGILFSKLLVLPVIFLLKRRKPRR